MHRTIRHEIIWILAFAFAPASFSQEPVFAGAEKGLKVTVVTYDYVEMAPQTLVEAKHVATAIFRLQGIEIAWLDRPTPGSLRENTRLPDEIAYGPDVVSLRIVPRSMAQRYPDSRNSSAFGFAALSRQGELALYAAVFFHRAKEIVDQKDVRSGKPFPSLGGVLGYVMAHEIGHVLGCKHASSGVMRSRWTLREITQIALRELLFTPRQGRSMRSQVEERVRLAKVESARPPGGMADY